MLPNCDAPVTEESYFGKINGAPTNRSVLELHIILFSEFRKVYETYDHYVLS